MICKVRYMDGEDVLEENVDLPVTSASTVSQVLDAGRSWLDPKNSGLRPWEKRFKLLCVKPARIRVRAR